MFHLTTLANVVARSLILLCFVRIRLRYFLLFRFFPMPRSHRGMGEAFL